MTNSQLKVAIVVPVYNVELYLRECLDSLLEQTYPNFIIIAVNDGSTDSSRKILKEYTEKDSRLITIHQRNHGVSSARNVALDFIDTLDSIEFICFIDSDDYVGKDFLKRQICELTKHNADYCVCAYERFGLKGILKCKDSSPKAKLMNQAEVCAQYFKEPQIRKGRRDKTAARFLNNKIFRFERIKGIRFDTTLRCMEDVDYFLKCLPKINKGVLIPTPLFFYRLRKSSLSHTLLYNEYKLDFFERIYFEEKYPRAIKNNFESCLLDAFWGVTQYVIESKATKYNLRDLREIYNRIKKAGLLSRSSSKNLRRLRLFSFGETILRLYFYLKSITNRKRNLSANTSEYYM